MPNGHGILVVAELTGADLSTITAELMGAAGRIAEGTGWPLGVLLMGSGVEPLSEALGGLGADTVYLADDPSLATYEGETAARYAQRAIEQAEPKVLLLGQTPSGRDLAARLAFRLGAGLTTDCTALQLDGETLVMTKPVYGGSAIAEYAAPDVSPQIATIRARAFQPAPGGAGKQPEVIRVEAPPGESRVKVVDTVEQAAASGPRLKDAKVVVSGGRGLGGPDNWHHIEELAAVLGAATGASRAVTDAGWVPASMQVGLTGETIAPDLYVTVAISGAVQHIAGCSGARNIVAINRDADANIFKHARYGVVGDWKAVLPAFTAKVKELRGQ